MKICLDCPTCKGCIEKSNDLPIVIINTTKMPINKFNFFFDEFKLQPFLQGIAKEKTFLEYLCNNHSGIIARREIDFKFEFNGIVDIRDQVRLCNPDDNIAFAHMRLYDKPLYIDFGRSQKEICFGVVCGEERFVFDGSFLYLASKGSCTRIYCN